MAAEDDQICPECGHLSGPGMTQCLCGHVFGAQTVAPAQTYTAYPRQAPGVAIGGTTGQEGTAIAGMICGIVAVITVCVWPLSVLCSIAGTILSIVGMKSRNRGMAIAGLVCSIAAVLLVGLMFIGLFALMSSGASSTIK